MLMQLAMATTKVEDNGQLFPYPLEVRVALVNEILGQQDTEVKELQSVEPSAVSTER